MCAVRIVEKQGRIHGNPVADSWAGAVMRKPRTIQKYFGQTYRPTDMVRGRVACPLLKMLVKLVVSHPLGAVNK